MGVPYLMKEDCETDDLEIAKKYIRTVFHRGSERERKDLVEFMQGEVRIKKIVAHCNKHKI